jgi:NO-binding membrane sensor protein with MHYT domain
VEAGVRVLSFSFNPVTAALAYAASVTGSMLGLFCTARARIVQRGERARWLVLAAFSIGGTGIWVMHFVAMLGSDVGNMPMNYEVSTTILSAVMSISVVAIGVFIVGFTKNFAWILVGGLFTGSGVAIMHYVGMSALTTYGSVQYDSGLVALSVVIGIVAATAALWATVYIRGATATVGAALIMGIAVSGMHYTGMAAAHVMPTDRAGTLRGMSGEALLFPLVVGIGFLTVITLCIVMLSPSEQEMADEVALQQRIRRSDVPTVRSR